MANSLSDKKNNNLPSKSKLDQTRSDIVGKMIYTPIKFLDFDYNFSYDRDLKNSNYQSVSTTLSFNNFKSNFNYFSENNEIGNNETISNTTSFNFNNENSLKFNATKNLKTDFTEYFNLLYQYETDCLSASVEYQKNFIKMEAWPDKNLFFVKIYPFLELNQLLQI